MNELSYYTLAHGDSGFTHQHVVDAYGAQHIRPSTSTIGAAFALAGLYLPLNDASRAARSRRCTC